VEQDDALVTRCKTRVGNTLRGKWRLDKLLGVGGMAAVYAASHRNGARAAIKLLHPEVAAQEEARDRFAREAYIANTVGHEGSVAVLDDDVDEDGSTFLVMELLEGESAADRANRNGQKLSLADVLSIASRTLDVLEQAHTKGIVHRDIKPENLFLTNDGKLKVLDFGIARLEEASGPGAKRTRTGMLLGTPGYMAPEQAAGLSSSIDARTDVWAVGATMFNLLTGLDVHEGETYHAQLINAATRPARSLASVWPEAPPPLVQVVDRALAFDAGKRFQDSQSMRVHIDRVAGAPSSEPPPRSLRKVPSRPSAPIPREEPESNVAVARSRHPEPASNPISQARVSLDRVSQERLRTASVEPARTEDPIDGLSIVVVTSEGTAAAREFFTLLEKAMQAKAQYGSSHKESARRFEAAYRQALSSVEACEGDLVWNVSPYAFVTGDEVLWEPKAPLDAIPYRLFADGVRSLGISRGLEANELETLVQIWTRDPAREIAPEDDLVTLLWDASFEHVAFEQYDSLAEGDLDQRTKFEGDRQKVLALANFDTSVQLEDCWRGRSPGDAKSSIAVRQRAVLFALGARTAEANARAAAIEIHGAEDGARPVTLELDDGARTALAARLNVDLGSTGERFVFAAATAFVCAARDGSTARVVTPLRCAVDALSTGSVTDAVRFICALCRAVERVAPGAEREDMSRGLAGALVSPATLKVLLVGATPALADSFVSVFRSLDATHLTTVLDALPRIQDPVLLPVLLSYIDRAGRGHEAEIGTILPASDVEIALALLRLLVAMGTPASHEAAAKAIQSAHPVVRVEALGHVEGLASDRLRLELKRLLEDQELGIRLVTLRAIARYTVKAAGPSLVLRIRSAEFDGLPQEERRQALETLHALMPSRAEAVSIDLLSDHRIVATDTHEQTRALAAELLARDGSEEAWRALESASKGRWRNSERVRAAATKALASLEERASRPPSSIPTKPPSSRKP
jgi:serine/threonine protein kinase